MTDKQSTTELMLGDTPLPTIRIGDDVEAKCREAGFAQDAEFSELRLGDFVRAVAGQKSSPLAQKALAASANATGGHLVPAELMPGVLGALVPNSALMQAGAQILPLPSGVKTLTWAAIETLPTAAWRNEGAAIAESDPVFRAVASVPRSLAVRFKVSRELLADAVNLEPALRQVIAQAMAREMDRVGLRGSGAAPEPRGLRNTPGIYTNPAGGPLMVGGANAFDHLMWGVIEILRRDGSKPTAMICDPAFALGLEMHYASSAEVLQTIPPTLRALRIVTSSQVPSDLVAGVITNATEVYIGDFTGCTYVMREALSIERLDEAHALSGEVGFVAHMRLDFVVPYPAAFSVLRGIYHGWQDAGYLPAVGQTLLPG